MTIHTVEGNSSSPLAKRGVPLDPVSDLVYVAYAAGRPQTLVLS